MPRQQTLEIPVAGMDCAECSLHVQHAIAALPGVQSVNVFLSSEKAVVQVDPTQVDLAAIRQAVESAGYSIPASPETQPAAAPAGDFTRRVLTLFGVVFGTVLFVVVVGEWLGFFESATERVPWPFWLAIVLVGGYPVFRNVIRATLRRQVISHTLMTLGVIAAAVVGQWATAAVVVFFMRIGDYAESFTTERARRAVKDLTALAPQTARLEWEGGEREVPVGEVKPGDTVVVRPGERIPVDGEVVAGRATVDQATITGESMPVEVNQGSKVFAATIATLGSLRVRATHVGNDTTFGRVIRLVEEAEAQRADVQRIADKFSAYYLPVVAGIAAVTLLIRHDPLATAAVLVVACSCSFALATPIAMLASVGAGAKRGLLIKGGKYLETLARADVLLIDKTGTLTLGRPRVTDVVPLNGVPEEEVLSLAATAERDSEHPLAEAVRALAREHGLTMAQAQGFESLPGLGVRARVDGHTLEVGNRRMVSTDEAEVVAEELEKQGKTTLLVIRDGQPVGVLGAADTLRPEVPQALKAVGLLGIRRVELLTGDNERVASALAKSLGVTYRANLLPEDKIAVVREYQAQGHTVVMVGDGVNDAPALAQADVGIAMGAAGTDVAMEAAHVVLMREDWALVPEVIRIAKRTLRVVKLNIGFTALYNVVGLSLAALGILPPILAAAAQSLPDIGILANSSRLLRHK
ncbi:MAG: cation-translocating P-type ATPase [Dehalococcoidales bacterium]|nr:cation-translocating P-type ATPase [Dehalococcoidales bacterium]